MRGQGRKMIPLGHRAFPNDTWAAISWSYELRAMMRVPRRAMNKGVHSWMDDQLVLDFESTQWPR
jgi:hypothetical protein